jgi:hypothetical protein
MPRRGGRHYVLVQGAERAMEAFKMEIIEDLGLHGALANGGFKAMTTTQVGQIGGEMVRRIQAAGEFAILQRFNAGESRLMPTDVLPDPRDVREVTNNGNTTVHITHDPSHAPNSGQFQ